jgi:hypothetical protein
MNRGDRREPIFQDDTDRECFLETLGEVCVKAGWQIHALLERRRKGDAQKVQMARRLPKETTMTWDWISYQLRMGAGASAANRLRHR